MLSSNAHVRREIAHAARILTCIDKRNGKYNQNQDPPSVSLLKVLLSKIYAGKTANIVGSNDPIEHVFYDYFYELCASILADVITMKNQLYLDILDLHNLAKSSLIKLFCVSHSDEMVARSSMHLIGCHANFKGFIEQH